VDVDTVFAHSSAWLQLGGNPDVPKDQPWYHVLVHDSFQIAYLPEEYLIQDTQGEPIEHPDIDTFFSGKERDRYKRASTKDSSGQKYSPYH